MAKPIECKEGQGVLFTREPNGNRPTLVGGLRIGEVDYEIAGWRRTAKSGSEYISLSIKPVTEHQQFGREERGERGRWQP